MSQLLGGALSAVVVSLALSAPPASAAVYVLSVSGAADANTRRTDTPDAQGEPEEFFGSRFTATLRFDTAALPANSPDPLNGESFAYYGDLAPVFTVTSLTVTGGAAPAFGGTSLATLLRGGFGADGFVELQDDRVLRDEQGQPENVYEGATLRLTGFGGLQPLGGASFPDFSTAANLRFDLSSTLSRTDAGMNFLGGTYTQVAGDVDSITFAAVPEPASWAMMAVGFGLLGAAARRRRAAAHA